MKKQLVKHFANKLVSFGYTVYIAKSGTYGFYTDGKRCISFGGTWSFSLDISGNYKSTRRGTGWQIAKEVSDIDAIDAKNWISENPPRWATKGEKVILTTPEQHLKTYGKTSGYTEYKGAADEWAQPIHNQKKYGTMASSVKNVGQGAIQQLE